MFVHIVGSQLFNSRFVGSQLLHVQLKYVGKVSNEEFIQYPKVLLNTDENIRFSY